MFTEITVKGSHMCTFSSVSLSWINRNILDYILTLYFLLEMVPCNFIEKVYL
jgi:hypothetical protein